MPSVFDRLRLKPTQLRTVADRRLDDAKYLLKSGKSARANAAMYLGGFVIECLLKAELLERYRWLQSSNPGSKLSPQERELWFLCYRSHDLSGISEHLPSLNERLTRFGQGMRLVQSLKSICGQWTIFARYSPRMADMTEATKFIEEIEELRLCLR